MYTSYYQKLIEDYETVATKLEYTSTALEDIKKVLNKENIRKWTPEQRKEIEGYIEDLIFPVANDIYRKVHN